MVQPRPKTVHPPPLRRRRREKDRYATPEEQEHILKILRERLDAMAQRKGLIPMRTQGRRES